MKSSWLAFAALSLVGVPMSYAQTSSKCADLVHFKIPGVPMVITKAAVIAAAAAPSKRAPKQPRHPPRSRRTVKPTV